jgi:hypothetical protein
MGTGQLVSGPWPGRRGSVRRGEPRLWTTDFNLATSGAIITRGRDGFDLVATIRRDQDLGAAIWDAAFAFDHPWFRAEVDYDFTGVTWEFTLEVVGDGAPLAGLMGPSLAITTASHGVQYVRLWKYRADPADGNAWRNRFRITFDATLLTGFGADGAPVAVDEITRIVLPLVPRDYQGGAVCTLGTEIVQGGTYAAVAVTIPGGRQPQPGDILSIWPGTLATDDHTQLWIAGAAPAGAGYPPDTFLVTPAPAFAWPWANTIPVGAPCQITSSAPAAPLRDPNEVTLRITGLAVTGERALLTAEDRRLPRHSLGMTDGWDNAYPFSPELVVERFRDLGFVRRYVMYVGMSHPQSFAWDAGLVRDGVTGGWVIDPALPPVNRPTRLWFEDFARRLTALNIELWISVSFEILNSLCPPEWRQRDALGNPALTGWDPPSSLVSPANLAGRAWLAALANDFITICRRQGCRVGMQIGEPWWWISAFEPGKPAFLLPPEAWVVFIYDPHVTAAWTAATGLPVPTPRITAAQASEEALAANRAYLAFCRSLLGETTNRMIEAIHAEHPGIDTAILVFTPQVLDTRTNVPPLLNLPPVEQWGASKFTILMIEDYDWAAHGLIDLMAKTWEVAAELGYPLERTIYFGGFVLKPEDAAEQWPRIFDAMNDAIRRGALQVMPWSREQLWRDGVVWTEPRLSGGVPVRSAWHARVAEDQTLPLSLDFASRRFIRDGRRVTLGDVLAFTRAGAGAVVDLDGRPAEVGTDVARLGRGVGLVLDPGRENAIPNPALVGAAVGVVGSGGALPVGWHVSAEITSLEVLALGEMAGGDARWPTITLRLVCDNTAGLTQLSPRLRFAPENGIPAAPGEAWAGSVFAAVLASMALKVRLALLPRDGSGSAIVSTYATLPSLFGRIGVSAVLPAGIVEVETALQLTVPAGTLATVDVVLALPMLEEGAGVSSPIRRSPGAMIPGANALTAPNMQGSAVGIVGSGGAMPDGWFNSSNIDTIEVLDVASIDGAVRVELQMVRANATGASQTMQIRFLPGNGAAAAEGEVWRLALRSQIVSGAAANPRLTVFGRNAGGSTLASQSVSLAGGGAETANTLTMPAATAFATPALQATAAASSTTTVRLVLWLPQFRRDTLAGALAGVRAAEDAALLAPVLPGAHGVLAIEAEERAAIGDGVMASFAWGEDWRLLVHGGADPGLTLTYRGVTVREERRLPVIPSAIVRFAVGWRRGRLLVAFNAALDRLAIDVADVRFRPTAAPAVRLGADADGGREALAAVRLVAGGPWQPTPEMVRGLAVDPGLPSVPSPWRLYRHAFAAPALADAPAVPFWSPIPYDTSDDTIGWNGPPPDPMPDEQIVPPDMIVPSMYGPRDPENPGRDIVHAPSYAAFLSIVTPIREFQKAFVQATDGYLAAGSPLVAFGMAGGMLQAAEAGVLTGVRNDTGTAQIERWLGCAGSAWLKISRAGFGTPEERAAIEAHFRQMADELIAFQLLKRATGSSYAINNHYFWASWGIALVGLILGDRAMIAWGHECLDFAIDASAEAGAIVVELEPGEDDGEGFPGGDDDPDPESEEVEGTQPAESVRLTRALHYHNFAMPPLVALAEIAIADGRDPYARRGGQLHKMAKFVSDAIDNPALMTAVQEAILGEGLGAVQDTSMWTGPDGLAAHALPNGSQMAWMWIYCRRFPDSEVARKWAPRLVEVYTSLRSSNLGGDMRLLYPWRHPTPARLVISFGSYIQVKAAGPIVTGTAEPGARVTITGAGPDRIVTVDGAGHWSIDMTDLVIGEWGLAAYQETELGIHPRVAFGISVIAHQAETTAVLNRWSDLGTPAQRARADALDAWIINMKSFGLWAKLDALYFPQHSADATRVNLINPAGPLLTLSNSPTIVPDRYLQGDGASSYFDTGINPATAGGKFALNDATLFVWSLSDLNTTNSADIGSGTATRLIGRTAGVMAARANCTTTTSVLVEDSLGLYGWRRSGSAGHVFFKGGGVVASPTVSSTSISSSAIRLGAAGTLYSSRRIAAAGFGGGLTDGDLYNLWHFLREWLLAIGAVTE